jgi:hypothetical protein
MFNCYSGSLKRLSSELRRYQCLLSRLHDENRWRNFLSLIQKSHFKSNNIQKLSFALDVYRGLAEVDAIRKDVLTKVSSMLLHPFPKVCS